MENHQIPTIGMRIDSIIAKLDSIPHTYQAFVIICCTFAFVVLNSNPNNDNANVNVNATSGCQSDANTKYQLEDLTNPVLKSNNSSCSNKSNDNNKSTEPQPKWHILKLLNILSVIGLFTSFGWFASNASSYINDSHALLKFTAVWSAFLCYFFGFFGISFIDADELERGVVNATNVNNSVNNGNNNGNNVNNHNGNCVSQKSHISQHASKSVSVPVSVKIHPPASCTPVCSDPPTPTQSTPQSSSTSSSISTSSPAPTNIKSLPNSEIAALVLSNKIKDHHLEKLTDPHRAVQIRRTVFSTKLATLQTHAHAHAHTHTTSNTTDTNTNTDPMSGLPYKHDLDYSRVHGANCETVIGYIPLPVGMVGPITLNHQSVYFPMATTEGCLVASTNRGCKAITQGSGAISTVMRDGITRAPCVRMESARDAALLKIWCEEREHFLELKGAFESTTSFGKLEDVAVTVAGRNAYIRLRCFAGDAMGMNMVSKGSLAVIDYLKDQFPSLDLLALSGNMCTDKKAAAINWIEGRGKSVVVEATIPKDVVRTTLKTNVKTIVSVNINKNLIGSAMAGAVGGFNAHASNIVTAVFLATGQDPAQNVESSNCMTLMEETDDGDLWISCTMPSIEVGTVGGGTGLPAQSAGLNIIGCKGGGKVPGDNAKQLAHVVASAVMAGELSLLAALAANTLVQAHMQHNRKPASVASSSSKPSSSPSNSK